MHPFPNLSLLRLALVLVGAIDLTLLTAQKYALHSLLMSKHFKIVPKCHAETSQIPFPTKNCESETPVISLFVGKQSCHHVESKRKFSSTNNIVLTEGSTKEFPSLQFSSNLYSLIYCIHYFTSTSSEMLEILMLAFWKEQSVKCSFHLSYIV